MHQAPSYADPLAYLPVSSVSEFRNGSVIYGDEASKDRLYLVLDGTVKIARVRPDQSRVLVDVYQEDEFFGGSCLVGSVTNETATALGSVRVMSWPATQIRELVLRRPELGFSLLQLLIQRSVEFGERVQSFAADNIERRAVVALLRFSNKLGRPAAGGGREMIAFTHHELAQYVGTSREGITVMMNAFRRRGFLNYSRKSMVVFEDALGRFAAVGISRLAPSSAVAVKSAAAA
jgi:CRP-like cAMP-binding protein